MNNISFYNCNLNNYNFKLDEEQMIKDELKRYNSCLQQKFSTKISLHHCVFTSARHLRRPLFATSSREQRGRGVGETCGEINRAASRDL